MDFCPTFGRLGVGGLGVEWIRFNVIFFDPREISAKKISQGRQDLQDLLPWLNTLRCSSKFNGVKILYRLRRSALRPKALLS